MTTLIFVLLSFIAYLLPCFIAYNNNHKAPVSIFIINFFLGWTLIGWIAALIWASSGPFEQAQTTPRSLPQKKCPQCAELILIEAKKCKHCASELS